MMTALLRGAAQYGRYLLVAGLVAGFALPGLAGALKPWLPTMVARLIFVSALRIGLCAGLGGLRQAAAVGVIAGNRNIALFLVAMPAVTIEPVLTFIGCYQVPMYLTPVQLRRLCRTF